MFTESTIRTRQERPTQKSAISSPLALWHLLSLDAPTVAALWTWFIARTCGLRLPWASIAAMALAVWILYAADRLLDARLLNAAPLAEEDELEPRHHFHHRHRTAFLIGIVVCTIALTPLLLHLPEQALRLYLIESILLVAWFLLIHLVRSAHRLPKELAVGPFFAAATFIPTVSRWPQDRLGLILPALLLSALCSLNCLYIYAWEHPSGQASRRAHVTTRVALRNLLPLTIGIAIAGLAIAYFEPSRWPLALACTLSAFVLFSLDLVRHRFQATTLRASADVALLTPLLMSLLIFWH